MTNQDQGLTSSSLLSNCTAEERINDFPQLGERLRKSCPECGSVRIDRHTFKGGYTCAGCKSVFYTPVLKSVPIRKTTPGRVPLLLRGLKA